MLDLEIGSFGIERVAIVIRNVCQCKVKYRLYRKIEGVVLRVDLSELRHFVKCFDFNKYETLRAQTKHISSETVRCALVNHTANGTASMCGNILPYIIKID